MNQAWLLVVVDVDTGGARLIDEQPNVRLEDVAGTAEDGQRAKPGQVGGEWTDARSLRAKVPRQCPMNTRVPSRPNHGSLG